jgi:hypothetical protein
MSRLFLTTGAVRRSVEGSNNGRGQLAQQDARGICGPDRAVAGPGERLFALIEGE